MIQIDLYNKKFDYSFIKRSEINILKNKFGEKFFPNITTDSTILEYEIDDFKVKQIFHKDIPTPEKGKILIYYFSDGNKTIIDKLLETYSNNMDYKIVVVAESYAEAWIFSSDFETESLYKNLFLEAKNFYLIHFQKYFEQDRCFFLRKLDIQNLLNFVPSVGVYYHMHPYFNSIKKQFRIGYHINRFNSFDRIFWLDCILQNEFDKKIFVTINKNQFDLKANAQIREQLTQNYSDDIFDKIKNKDSFGVHTFSPFYNEDWYLPNLFDFSLKSDIEIVYETNAWEYDFKKHLTEKTIKHLMLGKPFICCEPTTYQLLESYGFKNYDTLYSDELKKFYKETKTTNNKNYWPAILKNWNDVITKNIEWLINMSDDDWNLKMQECIIISEYNYDIMKNILFEETIRDIIKKISYE